MDFDIKVLMAQYAACSVLMIFKFAHELLVQTNAIVAYVRKLLISGHRIAQKIIK